MNSRRLATLGLGSAVISATLLLAVERKGHLSDPGVGIQPTSHGDERAAFVPAPSPPALRPYRPSPPLALAPHLPPRLPPRLNASGTRWQAHPRQLRPNSPRAADRNLQALLRGHSIPVAPPETADVSLVQLVASGLQRPPQPLIKPPQEPEFQTISAKPAESAAPLPVSADPALPTSAEPPLPAATPSPDAAGPALSGLSAPSPSASEPKASAGESTSDVPAMQTRTITYNQPVGDHTSKPVDHSPAPSTSFTSLANTLHPREPLLGVAASKTPGIEARDARFQPAAWRPANENPFPAPPSTQQPAAPKLTARPATTFNTLAPPRPANDVAARSEQRLFPALTAASASTSTTTLAGFTDSDELILEITTARHELNDTIIGYNQRGIVYLPLGEIARFLDLAITVSDEGRYATGWALDQSKTITLNLREGTLTVASQVQKLRHGDALAFDGELYLRAERFADILPLSLDTNLRAQTVTVQTRAAFPFQSRIERENARERLEGQQSGRSPRNLPHENTPWLPLAFPIIDTELRLASDSPRGARTEGDFRIAGDLAWLTAKAFLSASSRDGLTSAQIELGRHDPGANLLGPLSATEFGIGDITSAPLSMGLASTAGRGAYVSNSPLERAAIFDTIDLRGDLPDGYEAELYRNNLLIDSTRSAQNGQYQFLHVPVEFGLNVFRIVLYGPQGQRREIVRQVSVGDGRLAKGEFLYNVSAVQKNRSVFDLRPRDYIAGPDDGSLRTSAQIQYGLTGKITAALGGAWYERLGARHWLANTGLRTGLAGMAIKLDLGLADHGGRALELGVATKLGDFSVTMNHAEYRGSFADEVRSFSDQNLRRATEFSLNGTIRLGSSDRALRIPVFGFARDITFADGHRIQTAALNQSLPVSRNLQLSNLLEFNRTSIPLVGSTSHLNGSFDLATLSRKATQYRATFSYSLAPRTRLTTVTVEADHRIGDYGMIRASAGRNIIAAQNQFGLSAIRRFGTFSLAIDGNYNSNPAQYSAVLRLGVSFGHNPLAGGFFAAPIGMASGGALALRAYRDANGDGRFDDGDAAIPGVTFFTGSEKAITDRDGMAMLGKLGDGPRVSVRVDNDTLPDVSFAPLSPGIELAPRAGRIHVKDFAVEALGEVDGTAYFHGSTGDKAVSGLVILLTGTDGAIAKRTRTASDGSFWFEKLRPGSYQIRLEPGQAIRLGIRLMQPIPITVGHDGASVRQVVRVTAN